MQEAWCGCQHSRSVTKCWVSTPCVKSSVDVPSACDAVQKESTCASKWQRCLLQAPALLQEAAGLSSVLAASPASRGCAGAVLASLLKEGCSALLPYTDSMRQLLALRWWAVPLGDECICAGVEWLQLLGRSEALLLLLLCFESSWTAAGGRVHTAYVQLSPVPQGCRTSCVCISATH